MAAPTSAPEPPQILVLRAMMTPAAGIPAAAESAAPRPHGRPAAVPADGPDPRALLRRYQRLAVVGDGVCAALASVLALQVRFGPAAPSEYLLAPLLIPLGWFIVIFAQRGYEHRFLGTGPEEYRKVLDAGLLLFAAIAIISYAFRGGVARGYVLLAIPITVLLTLAVRTRLRHWIYRIRLRGGGLQRVLMVGRADAVASMVEKLRHEPHHGLLPVGACVPYVGVEVSHMHGVPVLGGPDRVLQAVDETEAHVVAVVSHPDLSGQALRRLSWALEEREVELIVSPGIIEVAGPRLSIRPVAGLSLLHMERPSAGGGRLFGKAVFDRLLGAGLCVAMAPLMLAIALAVRLTSPGPAFYRQTRVGQDGTEFTMLKFRSMVADADAQRSELLGSSEGNEMLFKMRSDPRVTRVGALLRRFSLDELPQLLNVVKGEMSLVGPRPPLPEEVAEYSHDASRRLKVRPGMTGLWQVSGRSDLTWEESLRLDLRYTDNWSLALDMSILWRTLRAVTRGSGAY